MEAVTTIGLDIAKSVFQVPGVDAAGQMVIRRRSTRWRTRWQRPNSTHGLVHLIQVRSASQAEW